MPDRGDCGQKGTVMRRSKRAARPLPNSHTPFRLIHVGRRNRGRGYSGLEWFIDKVLKPLYHGPPRVGGRPSNFFLGIGRPAEPAAGAAAVGKEERKEAGPWIFSRGVDSCARSPSG